MIAPVLVALAVLASPGAEPLPIEALAHLAPVVVVGEVASRDFGWSPDEGHLETTVHVRILERWRGAPPSSSSELVVRMAGGQVGARIAYTPGAPAFDVGARVVLFLEPRKDGRGYLPVGLADGVFVVDGRSARRCAREAFGASSRRLPRTVEARAPVPLEELRRRAGVAQ